MNQEDHERIKRNLKRAKDGRETVPAASYARDVEMLLRAWGEASTKAGKGAKAGSDPQLPSDYRSLIDEMFKGFRK